MRKNAHTTYSIAPLPSQGETINDADFMDLAANISSVTDSTDETSEAVGYYDGDGSPETQVQDRLEQYDFEGIFNDSDPAMKYIDSIKRKTGKGRKCVLRITYDDGTVATGLATVTNPITNGGEATEYKLFSCTIGFNRRPEITEGDAPDLPEED